MQRNSHKTAEVIQDHVPCTSCGKPVQVPGSGAMIEPVDDVKARSTSERAWHRECFNNYLDEGEET